MENRTTANVVQIVSKGRVAFKERHWWECGGSLA